MRLRIRPSPSLFAALALAGCMSTADQVRILQQYGGISAAPSSTPDYDYSVVMKNLTPLGVSTGTRLDRKNLAVAYLGDRCPHGKVVSETELASRTPGLEVTSKDFAVRLKC